MTLHIKSQSGTNQMQKQLSGFLSINLARFISDDLLSLSELLEVVDFDAALMKTFGVIEFANANLCLNVGPQAGVLGVSRTWSS